LTLGIVFLRRRRQRLYNRHEGRSTRQATGQRPPPTRIDPFTLEHVPIGTSNSQVEHAFISGKKSPLRIPPGEATVAENLESESPVDSRIPHSDSDSEDVPRRPSSSAANSLTFSTTTTARQQRLQEQEKAMARQLASLEVKIDSAEWVSSMRAEYSAMAAEMSRLRAEVTWFRNAQQSDWALGLSDEIPPPYSNARIEPRQ
jgi:hypothetical protein